MKKIRIQKALAHAGVASRRAVEEMIKQNRIEVNGETAHLGQKVNSVTDMITVDGKQVEPQAEQPIYIALHKPPAVLSTVKDKRGRRTVTDLVKIAERVYPVGRLDYHSEGLILLTNDGELANKLTHPRYHVSKEYEVLVAESVSEDTLSRLRRGGYLIDGKSVRSMEVSRINRATKNSATWLRFVLHEGRKRQIREVLKQEGHTVKRLVRIRLGPLRLGNLPSGNWRYLTETEITALQRLVKK